MQLSNADWETDPRVKQLQAMDSYLELQQKNLETQQKSAASQLESYQKILDTNVKKADNFLRGSAQPDSKPDKKRHLKAK